MEESLDLKDAFTFQAEVNTSNLSQLFDSSMPLQELTSPSQRFSMPASPCSSAYSFNFQVAGYCMRHTVENPEPRLSSKQLISLYTVQYINKFLRRRAYELVRGTEIFKLLFLEHFSETNSLVSTRHRRPNCLEKEKSKKHFWDDRSCVDLLCPVLQVLLVCTKLLHRCKSVFIFRP